MAEKRTDIDEIARVCSACGTCLYACPVYNAELIEPNAPRGKVNLIKALMDGRLKKGRLATEFMYHCLLCGSCEHICPNGVAFVDMMTNYRNLLSGGRKIPLLKKIILFFYQSVVFRRLAWTVDLLAKTPLREKFGIPRRKRAKLGRLTTAPAKAKAQYDILLFPGCVLTYFYPALIEETVRFLEGKGFSVVVPKNLHCCGFPFLSQGWQRKFDTLKKRNQKLFSAYDFKYLVVPCGTGVMAFKNYYDLKTDEIYELSQFIYTFIKNARVDLTLIEKQTGKITYHDPCHDLKSLKIEKEPRFFMKQFGQAFVDSPEALCCGFGGIFSVGFPRTSRKILQRKKEHIDELDAGTVVTACPGCYMHLRENLPHDVKFFSELFSGK